MGDLSVIVVLGGTTTTDPCKLSEVVEASKWP
jgi:hypothetical protein